MCIDVILPVSKCSCRTDRGLSLVVPKLGLGLSMVCSPGNPRVSTMDCTACRNCVGMSIVIVGPVVKLKKLGL